MSMKISKQNRIRQILDEVLKEIQPDKGYEKEIFSKLISIIKKLNKGQKYAKAVLGGSGAKGTWLKTFDADIFAVFDYNKFKDKSDRLSDILEAMLKKRLKNVVRIHGSRDYFQVRDGMFTFEIVPILKIRKAEQAKNITDVSPLHSGWVRKHKQLVSEMKLTKQFCHAQNAYGAESYIMGFSGYVCEILTVHYGSFLNLIRNAVKWGADNNKTVVDVQKYYSRKDVFKLINKSKLASPLIVIDPVQKDRNAAAALCIEKFNAFKNSCREFLSSPSKEFFIRKDIKSKFLSEIQSGKKAVIVEAKPLNGKADVVGSKLLRIYEFLKAKFQGFGFEILRADWEWDKKSNAAFCFLFDSKPLSKDIEIEGPPIQIKAHADRFKRLHKETFVRGDKIMAIGQRKFLVPEDLLEQLAKHEFVLERCKYAKFIVSLSP